MKTKLTLKSQSQRIALNLSLESTQGLTLWVLGALGMAGVSDPLPPSFTPKESPLWWSSNFLLKTVSGNCRPSAAGTNEGDIRT